MLHARQVYKMLENESLWQTAMRVHEVLDQAELPHAIMGGVAVCLHGYRRNTVDVDLLVRRQDAAAIREALEHEGYSWFAESREFRSASGVAIQFLHAGDRAGAGTEVTLPDPSDSSVTTEIDGLRVLTLAKLVDTKIACGEGNPRRTHKDFADVVELIDRNSLGSSFARRLHKSVRRTYRTLVKASRGES